MFNVGDIVTANTIPVKFGEVVKVDSPIPDLYMLDNGYFYLGKDLTLVCKAENREDGE